MLNSTHRTERRIERSRIACDVNNVQDRIEDLSDLMARMDDAMKETRDGSVEADLAGAWEKANDAMGILRKIRSRLETA